MDQDNWRRAIRRLIAGAVLTLLIACASKPDGAASELSPEDEAVYRMLALELADFLEHGYRAENGICIAVRHVPRGDTTAVPAAVFRALEKDAAGSATLISYSESQCPFDNWSTTVRDRVLLSASKVVASSSNDPNWLAGITFETLYGWGHAAIDGEKVSVKSLFAWIS